MTVTEFARELFHKTLRKPKSISDVRWQAMLAWWERRKDEGVKVEDLPLPFGQYSRFDYYD